MSVVMVTGANRGLGLEFCRQYADAGWRVLACCRRPESATALQAEAVRNANIEIYALDVADHGEIDRLAAKLSGEAIDLLINNAGVYGDRAGYGFGALDYAAWLDSLSVNALAPAKMAEAFLAQVLRSERKLVVTISSRMGSIGDNGSGGSLIYRSSKAAANAAMHSLAIDLAPRGVGVLILHPGWVLTDMGGRNALIDAEESVTGMRRVIDAFNPADSGVFLSYKGERLPW